MSDWSAKTHHGLESAPDAEVGRTWRRYSHAVDERPVDDPAIIAERLGILNAIIDAARRSESMQGLMSNVAEIICRRYPGLHGGVARFDHDGITIERTLPEATPSIDWDDLFSGLAQWVH